MKGRRGPNFTLPTVNEQDVKENPSRAVSAFANSGGGVIVLGLANPRQSWQVDDGSIELAVKRPNTWEWLEDVIPTLVDSSLSSFNVYVVQNTNAQSQTAPGRGVFIIEVPDGNQAPQQALDSKYYARVGGKSRPIGHRPVADIFGRRQHPVGVFCRDRHLCTAGGLSPVQYPEFWASDSRGAEEAAES